MDEFPGCPRRVLRAIPGDPMPRPREAAELNDRSSRPKSCPHSLPPAPQDQVIKQRRSRQTCRQISEHWGVGRNAIGR